MGLVPGGPPEEEQKHQIEIETYERMDGKATFFSTVTVIIPNVITIEATGKNKKEALICARDNLNNDVVPRMQTIEQYRKMNEVAKNAINEISSMLMDLENEKEEEPEHEIKCPNTIYFKDNNGENCSLQNSSAASCSENPGGKIWLGKDGVGKRMHLSQDDVDHLLPALEYFVENAHLPPNEDEKEQLEHSIVLKHFEHSDGKFVGVMVKIAEEIVDQIDGKDEKEALLKTSLALKSKIVERHQHIVSQQEKISKEKKINTATQRAWQEINEMIQKRESKEVFYYHGKPVSEMTREELIEALKDIGVLELEKEEEEPEPECYYRDKPLSEMSRVELISTVKTLEFSLFEKKMDQE